MVVVNDSEAAMRKALLQEDMAGKLVLEDGFFSMDDSVVGEHVLEMQQKDFSFASEYGPEFCKLIKGERCSYGY
jgi:hypothetical protein